MKATCPGTRRIPKNVIADGFQLLQVLNFAVKLALRQPEDTRVDSLAKYVLEMARFDLSHDLRDRARLMTAMLGLATADEGVDEAALLALNAKAGEVCILFLVGLHAKILQRGRSAQIDSSPQQGSGMVFAIFRGKPRGRVPSFMSQRGRGS